MIIVATISFALITCAVIDVRERRLPDWLTLPLAVSGLLYTLLGSVTDAAWHLLGAIIGFVALYLVSKAYLHLRHQHGLGLGDAKLLAAAGAWLGPLYLAPVVLIASVLALGWVQVLRLAGRSVGWQTTLPFGPFLAVGFFACWCAKLGGWSWGV
jgi:leader peptidase (prepilin peptidase)/N-methyltransferase